MLRSREQYSNRSRRRVLVGVVALLLIAAPQTAWAEGDLVIESEALYELRPQDSRLDVSVHFLLTNQAHSTSSGGIITQYYFDSFPLVLPDEAIDVTAVDGRGRTMNVTDAIEEIDDEGTEARVATIHFPARIYYRGTQEITFSFSLPGGEPRSDSTVRANPAYAAFPAWAWGDPDLTDVEIRIPLGFSVDYAGEDLAFRTNGDGTVSWLRTDIHNPAEWSVFFTARNDDNLITESVTVDELDVTIRSWPGDEMWAERIVDIVQRGLPELQTAVGLDFGGQDTLEIVESLDPSLVGYAGWYITELDLIEMGEDMDDHVLLHEIAHLWFNDDLFTERWITEGLADEFASEIVETIEGEADEGFTDLRRPAASHVAAIPLNDWEVPDLSPAEDEDTADREDYGYNASFYIIRLLRDEVGAEAFAAVLTAASEDLIAYQDGTNPETFHDEDDWRRFLDLMQEIAGSEQIEEVYRDLVINEEDLELLDERAATRELYAALVESDGAWETPFSVRQEMSNWGFTDAELFIEIAQSVVNLRDEVEATIAPLDLTTPPLLEAAYENAVTEGGLTSAVSLGEQYLESAEAVAAARVAVDEPRGFFSKIGLMGEDPEAEYTEATAAFEAANPGEAVSEAAEVMTLLNDASGVGKGRVLKASAGLVLLLGGGLGTWLLIRRRRAAATTAV